MFPDNRSMAEARLKNLKKRFSRDKQYHEDYTKFMEDMVQKGYAEKSFQQVQQEKLGLSLIMAYIIQASWVKYGSYSIAVLSITECP